MGLIVAKGAPKSIKPAPEGARSERPQLHSLAGGSMLIDLLTMLEHVPVPDKTNLTGKYDFKLDFSRDPDTPVLHGVSLPPDE